MSPSRQSKGLKHAGMNTMYIITKDTVKLCSDGMMILN